MDLIFKLLQQMRTLGASDLLLSNDMAPALRINGKLSAVSDVALNPAQIENIAKLLFDEAQQKSFTATLECNVGVSFPGLGRFRINGFRQRGSIALAIRAVPTSTPDFAALGLPDSLKDIAMQKRGLVLLVGACGSGKSTSLASMIDYRSRNDDGHIITIEDPVEFLLPHRRSMVNQREIGVDTRSYSGALMNALRQSPDVLMIGEIRDRDTLERALEFADTGHLCLSTLHANNANQTFDRIINFFREEERAQILVSLGQNLRAVISQRLLPSLNGARTLAYELLTGSPRVSELVRRGEFDKLKETMEKGQAHGMNTFDQSLFSLHESGKISADTALEYADSVSNLRLRMKLAAHESVGM
jgi:twitching motility protein PilU